MKCVKTFVFTVLVSLMATTAHASGGKFFFLECGLALKRQKARAAKGIAFALNDRARKKIIEVLPFKPTGAQKRVLKEIADDMAQPAPMNRRV